MTMAGVEPVVEEAEGAGAEAGEVGLLVLTGGCLVCVTIGAAVLVKCGKGIEAGGRVVLLERVDCSCGGGWLGVWHRVCSTR
jgi:hypothetical protein